MSKHLGRNLLASSIFSILLASHASAHDNIDAVLAQGLQDTAEQAPDASTKQADASKEKVRQLENVTVTAQRRVDELQDVPIAITAYDEVELERRQITSAFDLAENVPNLYGSKSTGTGSSIVWFLRGIGSVESVPTFDVPIGTYVDDIYISRQSANQMQLLDVQRIEVLRGPQGVQFGRNTTGGAINIISRKPSSSPRLSISATTGSYGLWGYRASADGPLADGLLGQFALFRLKSDGWLKSLTTGDSYNGQDDWGARAAVTITPSDNVLWDLSATYNEADAIGLGVSAIPNTAKPASGSLKRGYTDLRNCRGSRDVAIAITNDKCAFNLTQSLLVASNLQWNHDGLTLSAITGYYELSQQYAFDLLDNDPARGHAHFGIANDGRTHQFTQEFKVNGEAFNGRVKYVSGLYYLNEQNKSSIYDIAGAGSFYMVTTARTPVRNGTVSGAAYTQLDYSLSDKATIQVGARFTDETKDFAVSGIDAQGLPFTPVRLAAAGVPDKQHISRWTPKLAFQYAWTSDVMTYVSVTDGFKSGGWNARGTTPGTMGAFGPEKARSFEAGIRSELMDKRLRFNATAFHVRYDDLQLAALIGGNFITTNAGDSQTYGLEIESSLQATSRLRLDASVGLQKAKYLRLSPAASAYGMGPDPVNTPAVSGQIMGEFLLSRDALGGALSFTGAANYQSAFFQGSTNNPVTRVKAHTLLNAQLSWKQNAGPWSVQAGCTNCSDVSWFSTNLVGVVYGREPRLWSLQFSYLLK